MQLPYSRLHIAVKALCAAGVKRTVTLNIRAIVEAGT